MLKEPEYINFEDIDHEEYSKECNEHIRKVNNLINSLIDLDVYVTGGDIIRLIMGKSVTFTIGKDKEDEESWLNS